VPTMTKGDREELGKLLREQARLGKVMAEQRAAELLADGEAQLAKIYRADDAAWREITAAAQAHIRKADAQIAERCRELGIREEFRPHLELRWSGRGENAMASRRAELRRVMEARVEAMQKAAIAQIDSRKVDGLVLLAKDAVESEAARAFIAAMPSAEALMPKLDVASLPEPPARLPAYAGW
jgi:hypothetical protein